MDVYQHTPCGRMHTTPSALVQCAFPHVTWITGYGDFASLSWCGGDLTVVLCQSAQAAKTAVRGNCGPGCTGDHTLARFTQGTQ